MKLKKDLINKIMTLFTREIYSEERDPFLTVGKFFIGLIVAGFVILSLHVILLQKEAELAEVENSIKN